jgi:hypothetical protein
MFNTAKETTMAHPGEKYDMSEDEWLEYEQEYNDYLDEQEANLPEHWYDDGYEN